MHSFYSKSARRPRRWLQVLTCLMTLGASLPVDAFTQRASGIPPAAAIAYASSATSETCERVATMDLWRAQFNVAYSPPARTSGGYTGTHRSSADVTITFGEHQDFGSYVTWRAIAITGSGMIKDQQTYTDPRGDSWERLEGTGAAKHFLGDLTLHRATCRYDLDLQVYIDATWTASDASEPTIDQPSVIDLSLHNRPLGTQTLGTDPTISGNLAVPVAPTASGDKVDAFQAAGAGAGRIAMISREQGEPNAGTAAVAWTLRPNVLQPRITEVFFRQPTIPTEQWTRVGQNGTVDGNIVQIVALVENPRETGITLPARVYDVETGKTLPQCTTIQAILAPKRVNEVSCLWQTEGWAWDAPAAGSSVPTAHPRHRFRFEIGTAATVNDTKERDIIVRPKPVILVHGLNSNADGWNEYPRMLAAANDYWKGYAVPSMRTGDNVLFQKESNTLLQNAKIMHDYIEQVRKLETAQHVDIVAHSMGGLISRTYIDTYMVEKTSDGGPVASHLVMLGTPNQGSDCATIGLAMSLSLRLPNVIAPNQLRPGKVEEFNQRFTNQRQVKFSILAGNKHRFLCNPFEDAPSDQFVTVPSAHYIYLDRGWTTSAHTDMTSSQGDFVRWVLPHLATGQQRTAAANEHAQAATMAAAAPAHLQFSQFAQQSVAAGTTLDLPLAVPQTRTLGIVLLTATSITATLIDPTGRSVDTIPAHSARAMHEWRNFTVQQPAVGRWTLRLRNEGATSTPALVAVMTDGDALRAEGHASAPDATGRVTLNVTVSAAGQPVSGASAQVILAQGAGSIMTVPLFDDGKHSDGVAGDGVFGAHTPPLTGDLQGAIVHVEAKGQSRSVVLEEGGDTPPDASNRVFLPLAQR